MRVGKRRIHGGTLVIHLTLCVRGDAVVLERLFLAAKGVLKGRVAGRGEW